jgi:tetraacyldisaccharide 4'-kinase
MYNPPAILKPILFLPGVIYESLTRIRNAAYTTGRIKQKHLPGPVISIGNLTLGGAGKTPLAVCVAEILLQLGHPTALLSRGYGRRFSHQMRILPPNTNVPDSVSILGDEPALIRRVLPGLWMGISADRFRAGLQIAALQLNPVFILDDGFQHLKLQRDLDVVILDAMQLFAANSVFPRGSLREPLEGIRRSQIVFVNGVSPTNPCAELELVVKSIHPGARIFHCLQKIDHFIPFSDWKNGPAGEIAGPPGRSVFLAAAIGNPNRFCRDVRQMGFEVKGARFFRDHHSISLNEWNLCAREAQEVKASFMLTTEKDAIKISHFSNFPLFVAHQSTSILEEEEFKAILGSVIEKCPIINTPHF